MEINRMNKGCVMSTIPNLRNVKWHNRRGYPNSNSSKQSANYHCPHILSRSTAIIFFVGLDIGAASKRLKFYNYILRKTYLRNAPIASGIASNWKVRVRPNLSANAPPVKDPTVAPARVVLTTQPVSTKHRNVHLMQVIIDAWNKLFLFFEICKDTRNHGHH